MIGRLQTNKAKYAVRLFDMIHSVDRPELAVEIDRHARAAGLVMKILIEVNVAGEATKSGVPITDAVKLVRAVAPLPNLSVRGLMTMPPLVRRSRRRPDPSSVRSGSSETGLKPRGCLVWRCGSSRWG